ncbi:SDR family oxidoreductase [Gulosibacter chungangensis]|uniref:NAD(P)H-binding protein n=1 Tax=Gulosibacter chungangensis TaxID=979746 RepID=A0A7J5BBN8_9MICO|nr:NAD(P)H-binding protein [Gulosibacter chungangensis]KAB1643563.1 NAD(P)H-binding protein [Gulosibacter chungangensis]
MKIAVIGGMGLLGSAVITAAAAAGHETAALSRRAGVDITVFEQVLPALEGVDAVIDASSIATAKAKQAVMFIARGTRNLLAAERELGIRHHVAISIIGAAKTNAGYYAGKAAQEKILRREPGGWTVLRATQFHEFGKQIAERYGVGNLRFIPTMRSQPVAVHEVAEELVRLAAAEPIGYAQDLGGPEEITVPDMVRQYFSVTYSSNRVLEFPLPGRFGRSMRDGSLLPGPGARLGTQTYREWLAMQR